MKLSFVRFFWSFLFAVAEPLYILNKSSSTTKQTYNTSNLGISDVEGSRIITGSGNRITDGGAIAGALQLARTSLSSAQAVQKTYGEELSKITQEVAKKDSVAMSEVLKWGVGSVALVFAIKYWKQKK